MNYFLRNIYILILCLVCWSAGATAATAPLITATDTTPYQKLQQLYLGASTPADLSDFPYASPNITQQCLVVPREDQKDFLTEHIEKIKKGTNEKLFMGYCADSQPCDEATVLKYYDFLDITVTPTDLVLLESDPSSSSPPFKAYMRKANGYVFFGIAKQPESSSGGPIFGGREDFDWFGYCWNN